MIQAKELRTGSFIQTPRGIKCIDEIGFKVTKENQKDYYCTFRDLNEGYFLSHCEPVELTEEILLKCGFYYDTDYLTFCIPTCTIQLDDYGSEGYMCIIFGEDLYLINNLHQLQNLYWCLCGKELNIEL